MPVPTIPSAISLGSIQTEFGGSNPIPMSEYYSGAGRVPSGTANATSVSIPTSGTLRVSNFSGAAAATVSLTGGVSAENATLSGIGGTSTAIFRLCSNGKMQVTQVDGTITNVSGQWLVSGSASSFDAYFQLSPQGGGTWDTGSGGDGNFYEGGGSVGGDSTLTWLNLGTTREITLTSTNNYVQRGLRLTIRNASSLANVAGPVFNTIENDSAP